MSNWQAVEPSDVTLVVQLSIDRLQMIETICLHWEGKSESEICHSFSEGSVTDSFKDFKKSQKQNRHRKTLILISNKDS